MDHPDETKVSLSRTQRRAEAMRAAIVDIAESLYIDQGLAAVNAEAIAERADISVQTVYNRVGVRESLLLAITEKALATSREFMDAAFHSVDGDAEQRVMGIAAAYTEFARTHRRQFRLLTSPPGPAAQSLVNASTEVHISQLVAILDDAVANGVAVSGMDTRHAAIALWAMVGGLLSMMTADDTIISEAESDQILQSALAIMREGLLSRH